MRWNGDLFSFFNLHKSILSHLNQASVSLWLRRGLYTAVEELYGQSYVCALV